MVMAGDGPWAVAVMWTLTGVTAVFVGLRLYTRVGVVQSFGIDDHVYNLAFVCLTLYALFATVAAKYGFGQNMYDIEDPEHVVKAVLFEAISQTFAVLGMAIAKWSLGLFLLRIVKERWHKVVVWIAMGCLMGASISTCFVFWLQCTPPPYLWDRRIPEGFCHIDSTPVSMLLCILCVIVDFFFAIFPWMFIWGLQMNMREKIVILTSLSLGVMQVIGPSLRVCTRRLTVLSAGACGIKRTIEVPALSSPNYTKETVGLIVWSSAEIAVTMICIGIPICRPLYKQYLDRWTSRDRSKYQEHSGRDASMFPLRTFGGSELHGGHPSQGKSNNNTKEDNESDDSVLRDERTLGIKVKGSFAKAYAMGGSRVVRGDNQSDEEILGPDFRRSQHGADLEAQSKNGIHVTEEFQVTSTPL